MLNHDLEKWTCFIVLMGFLVPIISNDIRRKRIPDVYTIPGSLCLYLIRSLFFHHYFIFIDAVIAYLIIMLLWFLSAGKIGRGDAKLSALIAMGTGFLGWCIAVFWASTTGLVTALILRKGNKIKKKEGIPFAPFLAAGSIISFFTKDLFMRLLYVQ